MVVTINVTIVTVSQCFLTFSPLLSIEISRYWGDKEGTEWILSWVSVSFHSLVTQLVPWSILLNTMPFFNLDPYIIESDLPNPPCLIHMIQLCADLAKKPLEHILHGWAKNIRYFVWSWQFFISSVVIWAQIKSHYSGFDMPFWKIKINIKLQYPVITWKKVWLENSVKTNKASLHWPNYKIVQYLFIFYFSKRHLKATVSHRLGALFIW